MTIDATLKASISVSQAGSNAFGGPTWSGAFEFLKNFANGVAADQADIAYVAERTVTTGANDDIDLAGVLADALGTTLTMAKLVAMLLINRQKDGTANTTNLTIGLGTNPFLGFLGGTVPTIGPITPGGVFMVSNPALAGLGSITGASNDILRVANSAGATNKYLIALLARSA
ncbi:MAG: hypothetical protein FJX15_13125 [Alphaproteobacteria bacterium]|nr:hypothetical protein [Alphaproteobacteria bacterium]